MTPAEQIAAYHAMRPPQNLAEHLTAAELLGLELDRIDPSLGTTLRQRLVAYYAAPTNPAASPPARRARAPKTGGWEALR